MPPRLEISTRFRYYEKNWRTWNGRLWMLLLASSAVLSLTHAPRWLLGPVYALLAVQLVAVWWANPRGRSVHVDAGGVTLGRHRIPRAAIRTGYWTPAEHGQAAHVKLIDARGDALADIEADGDEGDQILAELGLGADRHATTFSGAALTSIEWRANMALARVAACFLLLAGGWYSLTGALALVASFLFVLIRKRTIRVATDGLLVHGLRGWGARFIPWEDVVSADYAPDGVAVERTGGTLTLRADEFTRGALLDRIESALAAYQDGDEPEALATRLARRGRDRAAWLGGLSPEGDFRCAPLDDDHLWHVVENAAAPPTSRAAAALVLTRSGGEEARSRLRIVAEACAMPRLRVVLDKAVSGADDESLGAAMDEVEDEDESEPARAQMRS